jgi:hypothetical protein
MPGLGATAVATPLRQPTWSDETFWNECSIGSSTLPLDEKTTFKGRSQHQFGNLAARINP